MHIDPACRLLTAFRSRRCREEVGWLYGTGHTEEPRRQREDRKLDATCTRRDKLADDAATDRWSPQHVRKSHWKARPREDLQLGARHRLPACLST
jgi:hypothetical protein